jgi:hypothetical protein
MQHQLVLQFRHRPLEPHDYVGALEIELAQTLGSAVQMDGHDIGSRAINLFILAADPASVFRRCKPVLEKGQLLDRVTAAHRVVGGERFKVIWPLRVRRKFALS